MSSFYFTFRSNLVFLCFIKYLWSTSYKIKVVFPHREFEKPCHRLHGSHVPGYHLRKTCKGNAPDYFIQRKLALPKRLFKLLD